MDSSSQVTYADIAATPLGAALGEIHGTALARRLVRRDVAGGDVLFRQGDPGDHLHLVLRGRLCALVGADDAPGQRLGEIGPGEMVGEMALLLGTPRGATVQALEPSVLATLEAAAWHELDSTLPELRRAVERGVEWRERTAESRRFRPDAAWIAAWLGRTELLAGADTTALDALVRELMWETLPAGEVLVAEGDAGACMWFVVRGRLRASVRQTGGAVRAVGEIDASECVGEMSLLSDAPRAATVKAVRDSELLRLPKAGFDEFSAAHPDVMLRLARAIVGRLRRTQGGQPSRHRDQMIALLPAAPDVPLAAFAAALRRELAAYLTSALLDGSASARAAATGVEDPEIVLLVCDATLTPWTSQCLRQADDLVVVGRATADPAPGALEREALVAVARREARCHLVLLHDSDRPPRGTAAWLSARPGVRHHHVRAASGADHARLARHLSGRATGLALSGGGARGFAHIGVLRALEEARVPIDLVAGTSMGAMIAAVHALGYRASAMLDRCRLWTRERPWTDATLPIASISGGRRVRRANAALFGDARIEDAWLPFACVTSNLTRATADVHSAGPLSLLVLASNSAPGLAPPVFYRDEVHVDGGLMDNLPVGLLRRMGAGRVIAVDVGTEIRVDAPSGVEECPSGWGLLWDRVRRRPRRAPPVHLTLTKAFTLASDERSQAACREADLTIRPALGDYASSDFGDIDAIEALGYESARSALAGSTVVEGTRR